MRLIPAVLVAIALAAIVAVAADGTSGHALFRWAAERQHQVQDAMAGAIRAIRAGDAWAVFTLCLLSGAYGFVHAMGPGHGKVLLGGAALAGGVTPRRMLAVGLVAGLAQAGAAILLVAVGVKLLALSSAQASDLAEGWLASASRWAMAALGALLVWRALRALWSSRAAAASRDRGIHPHHHPHHQVHDEACGCGHVHGPCRTRSPR